MQPVTNVACSGLLNSFKLDVPFSVMSVLRDGFCSTPGYYSVKRSQSVHADPPGTNRPTVARIATPNWSLQFNTTRTYPRRHRAAVMQVTLYTAIVWDRCD